MKAIEELRQATTDLPDAEALIREARQRQRRRYSALAVIIVLAIAGAFTAVATLTSRPAAHEVTASPAKPKLAGPPMGRVVSLKLAGPLAVGPNGALYVVDEQRHEVLLRLTNGQFRVVAGNGSDGYSGNRGPATKAALSNVSDITFGRGGDLYIADGGRVRVVNSAGTITTIAGDGHSGIVANGTPALSAPLESPLYIALSPAGLLYISDGLQILRLNASGRFATLRAVVTSGPLKGAFARSLSQIAVDAHGNIDVSGFNGWSIWQVAPSGVATEVGGIVGYARRSGGNTSVLERGLDGTVYGEDGSNLLRVEGTRLVTSYTFTTVPGGQYFWLTYFAFGPGNVLYADEVPGDVGFEAHQQLVSVAGSHVSLLWQEKNHVAS
ncbi:MAG: hypothetical protein ACLP36_08340 [Acidimicrobiales bacterium]|jgi:hypothetical protein